jgi:hypothetical protein
MTSPPRSSPEDARRVLLVLGVALLLVPGCSLFTTVPPEPATDFSLATPLDAVRSLKKAVEREDDAAIWLGLSDQRRVEDGITWGDFWTYRGLVKRRFGKELDLLRRCRVEGVRVSADRAWVRLVADDQEATVELVRESYYELVIDGPSGETSRYYDFIARASPLIRRESDRVVVELPLVPDRPLPVGEVVDARVLDEWKLYAISEPRPIPAAP